MLRGFARNLRGCLRQADILCRWGGEEFIVLLKDTDPTVAQHLAEKIRLLAEQSRYPVGDVVLEVNTSIGLTELAPGDTLHSLLNRADRALYRAKQSGRNRVCVEPGHVS